MFQAKFFKYQSKFSSRCSIYQYYKCANINFSAELQKYPESKLSSAKRSCFFDKARKEYFIDRHRRTFEVIASYINNGQNRF